MKTIQSTTTSTLANAEISVSNTFCTPAAPYDRNQRRSYKTCARSVGHASVAANGNSATFLKSRAMASRVGVSIKTLMRWANAGHINRFKPNPRLVLFDPADVEGYLRNANVKGSGAPK